MCVSLLDCAPLTELCLTAKLSLHDSLVYTFMPLSSKWCLQKMALKVYSLSSAYQFCDFILAGSGWSEYFFDSRPMFGYSSVFVKFHLCSWLFFVM